MLVMEMVNLSCAAISLWYNAWPFLLGDGSLDNVLL
jgi:hypothetical protein